SQASAFAHECEVTNERNFRRCVVDPRSNRRRTHSVRLPSQTSDALNQGNARRRSAIPLVRTACALSVGGRAEMGPSPSQRCAAVDFRRRCAGCTEARSPSSEQAGHTWERNSMNTTDIAAKFGDARRQSRAGASEIAAEAKKSPPAHPFNAVIDMIVRSASSYLLDKSEATAIRRAPQ